MTHLPFKRKIQQALLRQKGNVPPTDYQYVDLGRFEWRVDEAFGGYPVVTTPCYLKSQTLKLLEVDQTIHAFRACSIIQSYEIRSGRKHLKAPDPQLRCYKESKFYQKSIVDHVRETTKSTTPLISFTSSANAKYMREPTIKVAALSPKYFSDARQNTFSMLALAFRTRYPSLELRIIFPIAKMIASYVYDEQLIQSGHHIRRRIITQENSIELAKQHPEGQTKTKGCGGKTVVQMLNNSRESFIIGRLPKRYVMLLPHGYGTYLVTALTNGELTALLSNFILCITKQRQIRRRFKQRMEIDVTVKEIFHSSQIEFPEHIFKQIVKLIQLALKHTSEHHKKYNRALVELIKSLKQNSRNIKRDEEDETRTQPNYHIYELELLSFQQFINQTECQRENFIDQLLHFSVEIATYANNQGWSTSEHKELINTHIIKSVKESDLAIPGVISKHLGQIVEMILHGGGDHLDEAKATIIDLLQQNTDHWHTEAVRILNKNPYRSSGKGDKKCKQARLEKTSSFDFLEEPYPMESSLRPHSIFYEATVEYESDEDEQLVYAFAGFSEDDIKHLITLVKKRKQYEDLPDKLVDQINSIIVDDTQSYKDITLHPDDIIILERFLRNDPYGRIRFLLVATSQHLVEFDKDMPPVGDDDSDDTDHEEYDQMAYP